MSPAEAIYGRKLRTRLTLHQIKSKFVPGQSVWTRSYNDGFKWKKAVIRRITGHVTFIVELEGRLVQRHRDQIKEFQEVVVKSNGPKQACNGKLQAGKNHANLEKENEKMKSPPPSKRMSKPPVIPRKQPERRCKTSSINFVSKSVCSSSTQVKEIKEMTPYELQTWIEQLHARLDLIQKEIENLDLEKENIELRRRLKALELEQIRNDLHQADAERTQRAMQMFEESVYRQQ
uniref:Uncharacterized protein n=1 Tax=Panagrolaimus superbus TaxID=310955 RepID=A0A914YL84_9BILA